MEYTLADYKILHSFVKKKDGDELQYKGINPMYGMTISEIMEITELSSTKVRSTINNMVRDKLITYGIKNRNSNTYIITEIGKNRLIELKGGK